MNMEISYSTYRSIPGAFTGIKMLWSPQSAHRRRWSHTTPSFLCPFLSSRAHRCAPRKSHLDDISGHTGIREGGANIKLLVGFNLDLDYCLNRVIITGYGSATGNSSATVPGTHSRAVVSHFTLSSKASGTRDRETLPNTAGGGGRVDCSGVWSLECFEPTCAPLR